MDPLEIFRSLALSLLLGLLVGLQRERSKDSYAGFRTIPLITILGTLCAIFTREFEIVWMLPAGLVAVVALVLVGNFPSLGIGGRDVGVTTEAAVFVMFAVGAFTVYGPLSVAVVVASSVAILLYLKPQLHHFAARLGDDDFRAIMQFVLITFIVLPVLPNQSYDPLSLLQPLFPNTQLPKLNVLNPFEIWLLVVLVVGISLGGYVAYKLLGHRAGTVLGGILGGAISSTATTVSYSRRTKELPEMSRLATVVIMIAGNVMFVRILVELAVASPTLLRTAAAPLGVLFMISTVLSAVAWILHGTNTQPIPDQKNPSELRFAIIFAATYALVLVAVAIGQTMLSAEALYGIAIISGLTNVDAITLSAARLVDGGRIDAALGWRLVVVGALSNLGFKLLIIAWLGSRTLLWRVGLLSAGVFLGGIAILLYGP